MYIMSIFTCIFKQNVLYLCQIKYLNNHQTKLITKIKIKTILKKLQKLKRMII